MNMITSTSTAAKPAQSDLTTLEMAAADLEVANVFRESADSFAEEVRRWVAPDGPRPSPALLKEVHKVQTMLMELDGRLISADRNIQIAIRSIVSAQGGAA